MFEFELGNLEWHFGCLTTQIHISTGAIRVAYKEASPGETGKAFLLPENVESTVQVLIPYGGKEYQV